MSSTLFRILILLWSFLPFALHAQLPPVADFTTSDTGCTGSRIVNFQDLTTGSPNFWFWNFGDNTSASVQNPVHTYATDDTFSVTLIACNANGCDSAVKEIILRGPLTASCTPGTNNFCCNAGIYNVTIGSINNTTGNGADGYKDYSCSLVTQLSAGQFYSIEIQTGYSLKESVRAWIDFNEDGAFNNTTEKVFESANVLQWHADIIYIPDTGVKTNRTLRMRIGSDVYTEPKPQPCTNVKYGQFEDYGVIIVAKEAPPTADFTSTSTSACLNENIQFTDKSANFPNSWSWDFGDGATSTSQNPSHTYSDTGIFSVTLSITNNYGGDTMIKQGYIQVAGQPAASCLPIIENSCCGTGIYRLQFAEINNITGDTADGYSDFTCRWFTTVYAGSKHSVNVETGPLYNENCKVWIDYNNDGSFSDSGELVLFNSGLKNHGKEFFIPLVADTHQYIRMRAASDYTGVSPPGSCDTLTYGQVEDYGVRIKPLWRKPESDFLYGNTDLCSRVVSFTDYSEYFPAQWYWDFGDGATYSGNDSAGHDYLWAGYYTVTMIGTNTYGSDTMIRTIYIDSVSSLFVISDSALQGTTIYCQNYSHSATSYLWNFGDGATSTVTNPYHTYNSAGIFMVTLIAMDQNTGCGDTSFRFIVIVPSGIYSPAVAQRGINMFPNPVNDKLTIVLDEQLHDKTFLFSVKDIYGRVILNDALMTGKGSTNIEFVLNNVPDGLYLYTLRSLENGIEAAGKIIISKKPQ